MDRLQPYIESINEHLNRIPNKTKPASLYDPCHYLIGNGGKRVRPMLVITGCGVCGGEINDSLPAAMAVELIHTFTLVHDDLMDHADSRRGKPTVHVRWDRPTAILAGDILYAEAFDQLLAYADHDYGVQKREGGTLYAALNREILRGTRAVCEGQALDMEMEQSNQATIPQYLSMIEGKTAALISTSLVLGGIVATDDQNRWETLREFGKRIGTAFQIQDDLMDVTANPEQFGKESGGDIKKKKKTFLLIHSLEEGNESQRKELNRLMSMDQFGQNHIEKVISLFHETGSVQAAEKRVIDEYQKAVSLLNQFEDSNYKEDLESFVSYLIQRES